MSLRKAGPAMWTCAVLMLGLGATAFAQAPLRLDDLPPTSGNNRFFNDQFAVNHPSLSLNGFSCADNAACAYGLGLAEILTAVYADAPDTPIQAVYENLLALAAGDLVLDPSERDHLIANTQMMQARAFVALVTYVLEQNGNDLLALNARTQHDLPSHDTALDRFKEAALLPATFVIDPSFNGDAVKWTTTLTNTARAVDLYLALENAYLHYADPDYGQAASTRLLSCADKGAWLFDVATSTDTLDDLGNEEIVRGVSLDEVQPGNWPMKVHVAVGYAVLTQQVHDGTCHAFAAHPYEHWFQRALRSAGASTDQNRSKHWHYQTDNGKRFFAEGPYYFHLTLSEIVPFWHTVRLNTLLDAHPDFDLDDPFRAAWFTEPLHWLADLVTPDGSLPALDDGNKRPILHAGLLRWSGAYGERLLGQKMAWIGDRQAAPWGANDDLLLVELAIPRTVISVPPADNVGNTEPLQTGEDGEQQIVIRRTATPEDGPSSEHYVLLNGENGNAIRRGEGHEQSDQLQLLYYVDDVSYLLDSGYDDAKGLANSTWNHYGDHNVMTMGLNRGNREGGIKQPRVRLDLRRIVSNHQAVDAFYRASFGRIDVLKAQIQLDPDDELGLGATGDYRRTVLFIHDPHAPYLIDINAVAGPADSLFAYAMHYHGNSDDLSHTPAQDGFALWENLWATRAEPVKTSTHLFVHPFSVEYPLKTSTHADTSREPIDGDRAIARLDIEGGPPDAADAGEHTTVAFIRAFPHTLDGVPAVTSLPASERTHLSADVPEHTPLAWRYYTWWHDSTTVDVLAVRSAAVFRDPALRADEILVIGTPTHTLLLDFAADDDYGVARLQYDRATNTWRIDSTYQRNLSLRSAQPVGLNDPTVPTRFWLAPTVPNPFSTTTEIRFSLPAALPVELIVYDVQGREVTRLVDGRRRPGIHRATWEAHGQASGVYLLRLTAGRHTTSRRMVLLR